MKDDAVFILTVEDFECILGRKMTDDEIEICKNNFSIDDWSDHVDTFLDVRVR